ncbi:MAG TPA: hypothetical protein PK609_00915 [Candidatus Paceibacterota bacterium]|jgi:hypothetical protein|nr:hypothetical protein [Candidatus Paceibacterota bacterium]
MPFAKISFHTVMTWVILAVVFMAGSMIDHTYGDAWETQGWKIIPAMLYVCGAAYSFIWLIQLGNDPTKDSDFERRAARSVIVGAVGFMVSWFVLAYLGDSGRLNLNHYGWWLHGLSVAWALIAVGLYYFTRWCHNMGGR